MAPSFKASAPEVTANVASAITTRSFSPPQFSGAMTITLFFIIIVGIINILTMIASLTQGDKITVIVMFFNLLLLVIFRTVPLVYNTLAPLSFWFSLYFLLGPPAILFGISALDKEEKTDINSFVLFARRDATPVASYLLALVAVIELWGLPGFNFLQFPPTGWLSPINILILVALGLYGWEVWLRTRVQTIIQVIGMILLYFSPLFNIETLPGFMQNRLLLYITWILTVSALGLWYRMRAFESVDKFHEIYNPVLATKQASAEGKGKLENSLLGMFLDGVVDPLALTMTLLTMYIILMLQSNINFLF